MGIRFIRTVQIHAGKLQEAVAWAKEMAAYCEKKYATGKVSVFLDASGTVGKLRWMMDLADLAALDKVNAQFMSDPEYFKMVGRAFSGGLFFDGQTEDTILRQI